MSASQNKTKAADIGPSPEDLHNISDYRSNKYILLTSATDKAITAKKSKNSRK